MKTVLLTGFEPFNGEPINPSWEAVRLLDGWQTEAWRVHARELPCAFGHAQDVLAAAIDALSPDVVICIGQAGGRAGLTVERVALNIDDAPIPDNRQEQPIDRPIVAGAPTAYLSGLPIKAIVGALLTAGLPASVSQTAGTFVCNHVFYGLMHRVAQAKAGHRKAPRRCGFIHVPYLPEQAERHPGTPSLGVDEIVAGLRIAVKVSCEAADGTGSETDNESSAALTATAHAVSGALH